MKEGYTHLAPDPENWKKLHYHIDDVDSEFKQQSEKIFNDGEIFQSEERWKLISTNLLNVSEHTDQTGIDQGSTGRAIEYILKRV